MNADRINAAAADAKYPQTLVEAVRYFGNPDNALAFMVSIRWPGGAVCCPTCGSTRVRFIRTRRQWECRETHDKKRFSVKTGTIMEDSPLPLDKWLIALWLEVNAKNSISSYEVHRTLGVTQKTAWFMQQRIRMAMHVGSFDKQLQGHVEADETYIGGAARNMHADKRKAKVTGTGPCGSGKTAVMGLLERHGTVRTFVVGETNKGTLQPLIRAHVMPGSAISTDAWAAYTGLSPEFIHGVVDHAERYVIGNVHTNGLENFWALFKRCVKGTHISVEPFHLFRYLDAECFRFNNRDMKDGGWFATVLPMIAGKRLSYKALTGKIDRDPLSAMRESAAARGPVPN